MADHSMECRTCGRRTLHRSASGSGFLVLILGSLVCLVLPPLRGLLACFVPLLLLCAVLVPPTPIRCQACGVVNAREWSVYVVRAGLVAVVVLVLVLARQAAEIPAQ